jgi:hypothetical protein
MKEKNLIKKDEETTLKRKETKRRRGRGGVKKI